MPKTPKTKKLTVREQVELARQNLNLENRLALNIVETAAAIGVAHTITVTRLCQRGLLHPSRASRRPLFSIEEIKRFLAATM